MRRDASRVHVSLRIRHAESQVRSVLLLVEIPKCRVAIRLELTADPASSTRDASTRPERPIRTRVLPNDSLLRSPTLRSGADGVPSVGASLAASIHAG